MPRPIFGPNPDSQRAPPGRSLQWLASAIGQGEDGLFPKGECSEAYRTTTLTAELKAAEARALTSEWLGDEAAFALVVPGFPDAPPAQALEEYAVRGAPDLAPVMRKAPSCGFLVRCDSGGLPPMDLLRRNVWDGLGGLWLAGEPKDQTRTFLRNLVFQDDRGSRTVKVMDARHYKRKENMDSQWCVGIYQKLAVGGRVLRKLYLPQRPKDLSAPPPSFCYIQATYLLQEDLVSGFFKPYDFPACRASRPSISEAVFARTRLSGAPLASGHLTAVAEGLDAGLVLPSLGTLHSRYSRLRKQEMDSSLELPRRKSISGNTRRWSHAELASIAHQFREQGCRLDVGGSSRETGHEAEQHRWQQMAAALGSDAEAKTWPGREAAMLADWELRRRLHQGRPEDEKWFKAPSRQDNPKANAAAARFLCLSSCAADDLRELWLGKGGQHCAFLDLQPFDGSDLYVLVLSAPDQRFRTKAEDPRAPLVTLGALVTQTPAWDDAKYLLDRLYEAANPDATSHNITSGIRAEGSEALLSSIGASRGFEEAPVYLEESFVWLMVQRRASQLGLHHSLPQIKLWLTGRTSIGGVLGRSASELGKSWEAELRALRRSLSGAPGRATKGLVAWLRGELPTIAAATRDRLRAATGHETADDFAEERREMREELAEASAFGSGGVVKALLRRLRQQNTARLQALQGDSLSLELAVGLEAAKEPLSGLTVELLGALLRPLWPRTPPSELLDMLQSPEDRERSELLTRGTGLSLAELRLRLDTAEQMLDGGDWLAQPLLFPSLGDAFVHTERQSGHTTLVELKPNRGVHFSGLPACRSRSCAKKDSLGKASCAHVLAFVLHKGLQYMKEWSTLMGARRARRIGLAAEKPEREKPVAAPAEASDSEASEGEPELKRLRADSPSDILGDTDDASASLADAVDTTGFNPSSIAETVSEVEDMHPTEPQLEAAAKLADVSIESGSVLLRDSESPVELTSLVDESDEVEVMEVSDSDGDASPQKHRPRGSNQSMKTQRPASHVEWTVKDREPSPVLTPLRLAKQSLPDAQSAESVAAESRGSSARDATVTPQRFASVGQSDKLVKAPLLFESAKQSMQVANISAESRESSVLEARAATRHHSASAEQGPQPHKTIKHEPKAELEAQNKPRTIARNSVSSPPEETERHSMSKVVFKSATEAQAYKGQESCPLCSVPHLVAAEDLERHLRLELNYFSLHCGLCRRRFVDEAAGEAHFKGRLGKHRGEAVNLVEAPDAAMDRRLEELLEKADAHRPFV